MSSNESLILNNQIIPLEFYVYRAFYWYKFPPIKKLLKHEIKDLKDKRDKNHVDENVSEHGIYIYEKLDFVKHGFTNYQPRGFYFWKLTFLENLTFLIMTFCKKMMNKLGFLKNYQEQMLQLLNTHYP